MIKLFSIIKNMENFKFKNNTALDNRFIYLFLGFIICYTWFKHTQYLELFSAWQGFSPIDWLAIINNPNYFINDYSSGLNVYTSSMYMHIYILFNLIGISPVISMAIVLAVNLSILCLAYYHLTRTLLKDPPAIVILTIISYVFFTQIFALNFANFGGNIYNALYYDIADAFRLLAISFWLRKDYLKSIFILTLAMLTHILMGFFALVFIFAMQIKDIKIFFKPKIFISFTVSILLSLAWVIIQSPAGSIDGSTIPNDVWINITQLTNYHWYPFNLGYFTSNFPKPFSILCLLTLTLYSLYYLPSGQKHASNIAYGFIAIILVTILGVLISIYSTNPTLIKISLHRASELISRIGIVFIAGYVWHCIACKNGFYKAAAAIVLFSPFLYSDRPFLLISVLLLCGDCLLRLANRDFSLKNISIIILYLSLILLSIIYYYFSFEGAQPSFFLGGSIPVIIFLACLFTCIFITKISNHTKYYHTLPSNSADPADPISLVLAITLIGLISYTANNKIPYEFDNPKKLALSQSYLDVQKWVKNNTPSSSLFLVDISISPYGWRAFSERSYIGTPRQWISSWMYTSDHQAYTSGINHIKSLDINLDEFIANNKLSVSSYSKLFNLMVNNFNYLITTNWLDDFCTLNNINYIVLNKNKNYANSDLIIKSYENNDFIILKREAYENSSHN